MQASNRKKTKRIAALAFLLCFVVASLLSQALMLTHTGHEHDHYGPSGECAVCTCIQNAETLRRQFGAAGGSVMPMALIGLYAAAVLLCCVFALRFATPVYLKIRLNN